nr:conserved hypothetical protein, containing NifU-like domain [uncultured archaeon]
MKDKVKEVIEKELKPLFAVDGGGIELVSVDDSEAKLKLSGACAGCPMSQYTLANIVEVTLKEKVPELKEVILVADVDVDGGEQYLKRYERQIKLFGEAGQKKLKRAKVTIASAGVG